MSFGVGNAIALQLHVVGMHLVVRLLFVAHHPFLPRQAARAAGSAASASKLAPRISARAVRRIQWLERTAPWWDAATAAGAPPYYLALGDSLSQGVQPNASGQSVETKQGYADDLWSRYHASTPALRLAKLGCPGETTGTMLAGGCPWPGTQMRSSGPTRFTPTKAVAK